MFLTLLNFINLNVKYINNTEDKKVHLNSKNLDLFFGKNNIFNYKNGFFFKNLLNNSSEIDDHFLYNSRYLINMLIYQIIIKKIESNFHFNSNEYLIKIKSNDFLNKNISFNYNQSYKIKFAFCILSKDKNNNLLYKNENLILIFTQTYLYSKQEWINNFIDYQINFNVTKNENINYFREIFEDSLTPENKYDYTLNNLENIRENLSIFLTNLYANNILNNKSYWLYNDYKIKANVEYYKYLGKIIGKNNFSEFLKEYLSLTFHFLDNPSIKVNINFIILVKLV
ncbi:hypothetical protein [Spiroplasma syrphidicola]|uniref:hypothetical protein n=1 Tax=Spiroplasma syrphidicola TaxID=216945 RepID=UPI001181C491|nr:hypothetical protein [Spiroplasma syrphidicola]